MDFTGDGINDILSGCYRSTDESKPDSNPHAGYLVVLTGTDEGGFEEAVPCVDSNGDPLLNVRLTKDQEENYDSSNIKMSNICTAQHAVDYDGDGDLDLVTGCMEKSFFVFINSSDDPSKPPAFDSPAKRLAIRSPDQHSDPHLFDWDDDGDLDLLTGGDSGSVYLSINIGTRQKPKWSGFKCLVPGSTKYEQSTDDGNQIEPGRASRVWVTDYNRDGRPDLLVGDRVTVVNKAKGLTQAEFDRQKTAHESKTQPLMAKISTIQQKYMRQLQKPSQDKEKAQQLIDKMRREMEPLSSQYYELYEERSKFMDELDTGHVWVYLQQEATSPAPDEEKTVSSKSANAQEPERPL